MSSFVVHLRIFAQFFRLGLLLSLPLDFRLAALDILRSEQLRAYSAHLALYHPLAYHQPSHAIPPTTTTSASPASSSSSGAHPAATAAALAAYASSYYGALTQHPHHTPSHYYPSPAPSTSAHASAPTQPRRCASARGKNDEASPKTAHSSTTADRTSRSPSLTRSSTSRQSSVDLEAVKTPSEENALAIIRDAFTSPRTNDFSLPAAAVASTSNDDSAAMSVASSLVAAAAAAQQTAGKAHKRKRPIGGIREEEEEEEEDTDDQARDHRRFVRRTTPPGAINSRRVVHTQAPRSLKHILNDDLLRPLGNTRVATSDVRSRSLSGEE